MLCDNAWAKFLGWTERYIDCEFVIKDDGERERERERERGVR